MTPHELIARFEDVADAPDGVKRLRELVLSLAVRGRLLPRSRHIATQEGEGGSGWAELRFGDAFEQIFSNRSPKPVWSTSVMT